MTQGIFFTHDFEHNTRNNLVSRVVRKLTQDSSFTGIGVNLLLERLNYSCLVKSDWLDELFFLIPIGYAIFIPIFKRIYARVI